MRLRVVLDNNMSVALSMEDAQATDLFNEFLGRLVQVNGGCKVHHRKEKTREDSEFSDEVSVVTMPSPNEFTSDRNVQRIETDVNAEDTNHSKVTSVGRILYPKDFFEDLTPKEVSEGRFVIYSCECGCKTAFRLTSREDSRDCNQCHKPIVLECLEKARGECPCCSQTFVAYVANKVREIRCWNCKSPIDLVENKHGLTAHAR